MTKSATATPGLVEGQVRTVKIEGSWEREKEVEDEGEREGERERGRK